MLLKVILFNDAPSKAITLNGEREEGRGRERERERGRERECCSTRVL
jgi:hypothetical protein